MIAAFNANSLLRAVFVPDAHPLRRTAFMTSGCLHIGQFLRKKHLATLHRVLLDQRIGTAIQQFASSALFGVAGRGLRSKRSTTICVEQRHTERTLFFVRFHSFNDQTAIEQP